MNLVTRFVHRLRTMADLLAYLARRQRAFLIPLVAILLCAALLLLLTGGLSYVAPFVYPLF